GVDNSALGGTKHRRFRKGNDCAEQGAPRWTLCARLGSAHSCKRKTDRGLCAKEPVTVSVRQQRSCGCRRAHILRGRPQRYLPPCCHLCGQNLKRCESGGSSCRTAEEV